MWSSMWYFMVFAAGLLPIANAQQYAGFGSRSTACIPSTVFVTIPCFTVPNTVTITQTSYQALQTSPPASESQVTTIYSTLWVTEQGSMGSERETLTMNSGTSLATEIVPSVLLPTMTTTERSIIHYTWTVTVTHTPFTLGATAQPAMLSSTTASTSAASMSTITLEQTTHRVVYETVTVPEIPSMIATALSDNGASITTTEPPYRQTSTLPSEIPLPVYSSSFISGILTTSNSAAPTSVTWNITLGSVNSTGIYMHSTSISLSPSMIATTDDSVEPTPTSTTSISATTYANPASTLSGVSTISASQSTGVSLSVYLSLTASSVTADSATAMSLNSHTTETTASATTAMSTSGMFPVKNTTTPVVPVLTATGSTINSSSIAATITSSITAASPIAVSTTTNSLTILGSSSTSYVNSVTPSVISSIAGLFSGSANTIMTATSIGISRTNATALPSVSDGSSSISSQTVSNAAQPTTLPCGSIGPFTLNFDDLPPLAAFNNDTATPMPLFSPYHQFSFSEGFVVVPPPTDPYVPASSPLLLAFIAAPSNAEGNTGDIGNGIYSGNVCFLFDALGAALGCDSMGPPCDWQFTGTTYNVISGVTNDVATQYLSTPACPGLTGCPLVPVTLSDNFQKLNSLRINVTVAGVPKIWWMDNLNLNWSNNTCAAGLCRESAPRK